LGQQISFSIQLDSEGSARHIYGKQSVVGRGAVLRKLHVSVYTLCVSSDPIIRDRLFPSSHCVHTAYGIPLHLLRFSTKHAQGSCGVSFSK
jgi:hypothetical protein